MKIALGSDHRGHEVRRHLAQWLVQQEYEVVQLGPQESRSCDYPDSSYLVGQAVADGSASFGILVDGSGIGMCIAANKVRGVRAALVHDEISAEISRRHSDANVLCLPADMLGQRIIDRLVRTWLTAEFEGGRHGRRVRKILAIEQGLDPQTTDDSPAMSE